MKRLLPILVLTFALATLGQVVDVVPQKTGEPIHGLTGKVTVKEANIFSQANAQSTVIGSLTKGMIVRVFDGPLNAPWRQVQYRQKLGWIRTAEIAITLDGVEKSPLDELSTLEKLEKPMPNRDPLTGQVIPAEPPPAPSMKSVAVPKACKLTITKAYDEVEDETYFYGKDIVLTRNRRQGILVNPTLLEDGSYVAIRFTLAGIVGCVRENTKISILFRDGTRLFTNSGNSTMTCNGKAALYFGGPFESEKDLKLLMEKPIKTIRIYTFDSYIEEDFTVAQSNNLIASLKCLFDLLVKY